MKIILLLILERFQFYTPRGDWAFKDDLQDNEVRPPQPNDSYSIIDHHNVDYIQEKQFNRLQQERFKNIIQKYEQGLDEILQNENLDPKTCAEPLIELYGENFDNIVLDIQDIMIDIKAYIENQINMFFLYECQNIYFKSQINFGKCSQLRKNMKERIMFENFFKLGWKNLLLNLQNSYQMNEDFFDQLMFKVNRLNLKWKLFINTLKFTKKQLINTAKRKIISKFGSGVNIQLTVNLN